MPARRAQKHNDISQDVNEHTRKQRFTVSEKRTYERQINIRRHGVRALRLHSEFPDAADTLKETFKI